MVDLSGFTKLSASKWVGHLRRTLKKGETGKAESMLRRLTDGDIQQRVHSYAIPDLRDAINSGYVKNKSISNDRLISLAKKAVREKGTHAVDPLKLGKRLAIHKGVKRFNKVQPTLKGWAVNSKDAEKTYTVIHGGVSGHIKKFLKGKDTGAILGPREEMWVKVLKDDKLSSAKSAIKLTKSYAGGASQRYGSKPSFMVSKIKGKYLNKGKGNPGDDIATIERFNSNKLINPKVKSFYSKDLYLENSRLNK